MKWVEIPSKYLRHEGIHVVRLPEKTFCLTWYKDQYVAFSRKCPHAGAPMEQGWVEGHQLVCAYHRQRFDLKTGKGEVGQGNFIHIYPTKELDGKWCVGLKKTFWQKLF